MRIFVGFLIASLLLISPALAQKPAPPPTPPPVSGPPRNNIPTLPAAQPQPFSGDLILFLSGNVKTDDNTALPGNVIIERVCNARVRQQVYADLNGEFSMELGTTHDQLLDASGDAARDSPRAGTQNAATDRGIPRQALTNCEMRASASGFRSDTISLVDLTPSASAVRLGAIVVHRNERIEGQTLSAAVYRAPKNALRAYQKGLEAEKRGKLADAQAQFEQAVKIYPQYAYGWFELGEVLQKQTKKDAAKAAYLRATAIDSKFLQPCLALASMAYEQRDWPEVLGLTRHILNLDTLDYGKVNGYVLDLDSLDYSQAYFYNAAANFKLNRIDEAEKSGLQAERLDVRPLHPQLRLLMAEIYFKKNNYAGAADQLRDYLRIVPQGKAADLAREQLASLEKAGNAAPADSAIRQN